MDAVMMREEVFERIERKLNESKWMIIEAKELEEG